MVPLKKLIFLGVLMQCSAFQSTSSRQISKPHETNISKKNFTLRRYGKESRHKDGLQTNLNSVSNEEISSIIGIPKSTAKPLGLLLFAQFILFIGVGAVIPTIPLYGKEIGLTGAMNGIVISAPALALLLLAKVSGEYADKARKPAMMIGMGIIAISDLGTALSQSIIPLVIARLGLGAGRCISESGERGILADFANTIPSLRGRALASQQAVLALGIAIGAPVGGFVVESYSARAAFLCVTAAALITLGLYVFLPETIQEADSSNHDSNKNKRESVEWGELLKQSEWRGLSIFMIGEKFGYAAKIASIPLIASQIFPNGAMGAGELLSAAGLSGLLGAPLGGYLTDNIGSKNTLVITGLASGVGLVAIPFALAAGNTGSVPAWLLFSFCVITWSISVAAQNPSTMALAQELAPEGSEATAIALPRAAGDSVYLFAPFLLGAISDMASLPNGSECMFAGICAILGTAALAIL